MICILHGWLLEGSGSNLWTRSVVRSLCKRGEDVHLVCQENHPERYDFISASVTHRVDGSVATTLDRSTRYPGKCVLHKPELGVTLPVFVWDKYEEYSRVVPMTDLSDEEIESYVARNLEVVGSIVADEGVTVIHANHAVMMPVVAQRVEARVGIPFTVMPHGSDIEYAVKKDPRFLAYASSALEAASRIFVIGDEMRGRVRKVFAQVPHLEEKLSDLHLGVDTSEFVPVPRAKRRSQIEKLTASLASVPRGKTAEQETGMLARLAGVRDLSALQSAMRPASRYDAKRPDADVEAKLESVPWDSAPTLAFVGRLIAWKGIQSLLAALPLVLEKQPEARTIVVGHGPLREPMEAFIWALQHGARELVETIVQNGRLLDGSAEAGEKAAALDDVRDFYAKLEERGELDRYFELAERHIRDDSVLFTGYLTHRELRHLFPSCDAGVFSSVVREAGPLVFLEALASGCFPLGTYFGGMAASIDAVGEELPADATELMKLDPRNTVEDLARKLPLALESGPRYRDILSRVARERYDWSSVSGKFLKELRAVQKSAQPR